MLDKLTTEKRNQNTMNLDEMTTREILVVMNKEDESVPKAIERELDQIEAAVQLVIASFQKQGRLIYVGAGTSGRLGILDAVECMPTFNTSEEMVQGFLAGGMKAFTVAVEGAEDDPELGKQDLMGITIGQNDTVMGIAASGRTPYVIGALQYAREQGAKTVSISCNKSAEISKYADVAIEVVTGSEVLSGSTRLKAGTAQKLILNMISTSAMIGVGKVYQNLMVDVKATNEKLVERSKRIIMEATGVNFDTAEEYYEKSHHHVKESILMILTECTFEDAKARLTASKGFVRNALK